MYYLIYTAAIVLLIALDQLVKYLTVTQLANKPIVLWEGVFELVHTTNRGAAFGILQGQQWLFKVFTGIFILLAIYVLYKRIPKTKYFMPLQATAVLFVAGGIGNLIDRVRQNYVIDTFYFKLIDFPVFNVADSCVVVGSILFAIVLLFKYKDEDFEFLNLKKINKQKKDS